MCERGDMSARVIFVPVIFRDVGFGGGIIQATESLTALADFKNMRRCMKWTTRTLKSPRFPEDAAIKVVLSDISLLN